MVVVQQSADWHAPALLTLDVLLLITGLQCIGSGLVGEMMHNAPSHSDEYCAVRQILSSHETDE